MIVTALNTKQHYETRISARNNVIIADETTANGGKDSGFTPHELLGASLASCTSITLRMYADRKKINLEEIRVEVSSEHSSEKNTTILNVLIHLEGDMTPAEKSRLLEIANLCPIHKLLEGTTKINSSIV